MKIALVGYGKMGQIIEKLALSRGHSIVARLTSSNWDHTSLLDADTCMEFSHPQCVLENIYKIAKAKKQVIIGTTGWDDSMEQVRSIIEKNQIGALYSPNFSIGANALLKILEHAAVIMNAFKEYEVAGVDYHHKEKRDSPSGTAKVIAKVLEKSMSRINKVPFTSIRCGSIPGTHTILFDSPYDTISVTHEARNRNGFAQGAVLAAEWLQGKKGLYTFDRCIEEIIAEGQNEI